ncbi:glycosyltransferase [Halolamina salina]|uniref:Glycosyltransferase n=1 Tax=Halolamina salina TaxID=1220023 RepID=A0ABD6B653_9EURY
MTEIAVAHEHYLERGGGEHVADTLARTFDADIYAGLVREDATADDLDPEPICDGAWASVMERSVFARDLTYFQAWRHASDLHDYDAIIQSGNNPGWYVPQDDQTIIKYVHSPQRTPYDRWANGDPGALTRAYAEAARQLYQETLTHPDVFVANSEVIARRCRKYWGVPEDKLEVVYPPVDTESYGQEHATAEPTYYFTFSRLYPSKRIDQIVRAFTRLDDSYQLVVGGSGPDRDRLESIADDSVQFVGYLSEAEKPRRLAECRAFIFAAENEDFGLCPIEAFASGTPVLGVNEGFTQHQILAGQNGYTFGRDPGDLDGAIHRFEREGAAWSPTQLETFAADNFGRERFAREMQRIVMEARERSAIDVSYDRPLETTDDAQLAVTDGGTDE